MRIWGVVVAIACGCGGKAPAKPPEKPTTPVAHADAPAKPVEAAAPKEPMVFHAKVAMTPTKASKLEPFVVGFMQREGDNALVLADLPVGVKAGTYHYIIHEGEDCAKPGNAWRETYDQDLKLVVEKDLTGALDNSELVAHLEGPQTIVKRTFVLHEDTKGKPGKVLACGTIEESAE
jgi:hypothetical protein